MSDWTVYRITGDTLKQLADWQIPACRELSDKENCLWSGALPGTDLRRNGVYIFNCGRKAVIIRRGGVEKLF